MCLYHLACLQEVRRRRGEGAGLQQERAGPLSAGAKVKPKPLAWYNLGYVQEELGRFADAVKSFKTALELRPNDKDALINLGNCYMEMDKFEDSVETYHEAIRLSRTASCPTTTLPARTTPRPSRSSSRSVRHSVTGLVDGWWGHRCIVSNDRPTESPTDQLTN